MSRIFKRVVFSLVVLAAALGAAELVLLELNQRRDREDKREYWTSDSYIIPDDPVLGYSPVPGSKVEARLSWDHAIQYDVVYNFDDKGRRYDPSASHEGRQNAVLFFGGSFTFGEGLHADETLPARVEALSPEYQAYNYGFHGYGPQEMLARLRAMKPDDLPARGDKVMMVYVFTDYHMRRAVGAMSVVTAWGAIMPCFEPGPDGRLIDRGLFADVHPWRQRLYGILAKDQAVKYFKLDFPLTIGKSEARLVAEMAAESREEFEKKSGSKKFLVLIYPGSRYRDLMVSALKQKGIDYLDYSSMFDMDDPSNWVCPHDRHPSAEINSAVAERLVKDLGIGR